MATLKDFDRLKASISLFLTRPSLWGPSLIPVVLSFLIYFFVGKSLIETFKSLSFFSFDSYGAIAWVLSGVVMAALLYLSFLPVAILLFGFIGGYLSEKTLKIKKAGVILPSTHWKQVFFMELKKFLFFSCLSSFGLLLGFIPIFTPIVYILGVFAALYFFLEYPCSVFQWQLKEILQFIGKNKIKNFIRGVVASFVLTVPILNILVIPVGIIFFTLVVAEEGNQVTTSP